MASRKAKSRGHRRERRKAHANPGKDQKQRMGVVGHGGNGPMQASGSPQKMTREDRRAKRLAAKNRRILASIEVDSENPADQEAWLSEGIFGGLHIG